MKFSGVETAKATGVENTEAHTWHWLVKAVTVEEVRQ